jgi:hypothetical protein
MRGGRLRRSPRPSGSDRIMASNVFAMPGATMATVPWISRRRHPLVDGAHRWSTSANGRRGDGVVGSP